MERIDILTEYKNWLLQLAFDLLSPYGIYQKLIEYLMSVEFVATIPFDDNRIGDAKDLRLRFVEKIEKWNYRDIYMTIYDIPVSVLEVMVALAIRCEETIMVDPDKGDRTGLWLYTMIESLHLHYSDDNHFDTSFVEDAVLKLLNHEYEPDGDGSLFHVPGTPDDFRTLEIWSQMNRYLNYLMW